jgi:hypothetical protein
VTGGEVVVGGGGGGGPVGGVTGAVGVALLDEEELREAPFALIALTVNV